jgi:chromosome segregation protein
MRIRSLEMMGFKSFPERTVLQFGEGVSCIVGPNGCGKSNIIDALRWCIGEQSAKRLRGGEMMDVIFAGSSERKAVGYAEVSLTLSAEDGQPFPGNYASFPQLQVGRRLHRSGQSEYFVNQNVVRRRDVVDLFMDTGIGNNLYSFIEQGRIGEIVQARPESRRGLIDEAAGISKYKVRRDEAQRRLEATANQLDRAADVADEMGRRLRGLARQVVKAAEFRRVRALIRQNEICLSLVKYAHLAADRRALREEVRVQRASLARLEREVLRQKAQIETRREELSVVEEGVVRWRDELAELDATIREKRGESSFEEKRKAELAERISVSMEDVQKSREDHEESTGILHRIKVEKEDTKQRLTTLSEGIETLEGELGEILARQSHLGETAENSKRLLLEEEARLEVRRVEVEKKKLRQEALPALIDEAIAQVEQLQGDARKRDNDQSRQREAKISLDARLAETQGEVNALLEKERALAEQLDALNTEVQSQVQSLKLARRDAEAAQRAAARALQGAQDSEKELLETCQQDRERWMEQGRMESSDRLATERAEAQEQLDACSERLRRWMDAWEGQIRATALALEHQDSRARRALTERFEKERVTLQQKEQTDTEQEVSELNEALTRDATRTSQSVAESRKALASEHAHCVHMKEDREDLKAALAETRATLHTLVEVKQSANQHIEDLSEVLDDSRPLMERVSAAEKDRSAALLDARVALPVVRTRQEVQRLVDRIGDSSVARFMWLRHSGESLLQSYEESITVCDSVQEAMTLFESHGGTVVVESTGDRFHADGLVELGNGHESGKLVIERERRIAELGHREIELTQSLHDLTSKIQTSDSKLALLKVEVEDAEAAAELHAERGQQALRATYRRAELRTSERLAALEDTRNSVLRRLEEQAVQSHAQQTRQVDLARKGLMVERSHLLRILQDRFEDTIYQAEVRERELLKQAESVIETKSQEALFQAAERVHQGKLAVEKEQIAGHEQLESLEHALNDAHDCVQALRTTLERARLDRVKVEQRATANQLEQGELKGVLERSGVERTLLEERIQRAERDLVLLQEEFGTSAVQAGEGKDNGEDETELVRRRAVAEVDSKALMLVTDLAREKREQLGERRIEQSAHQERLHAGTRAKEEAVQRKARAVSRMEEGENRILELRTQLDRAGEREKGLLVEQERLALERVKIWDQLQRQRQRVVALKSSLDEVQEALAKTESQRNSDATEAAECERRVLEVKGSIESIRDRMDDRYQVSLAGLLDRLEGQGKLVIEAPTAVQKPVEVDGKVVDAVENVVMRPGWLNDEARIAKRVEALEADKASLARIGEVNLMALEEYDDVLTRHRELESQRVDLEQSVQRIRTAIAKMNRTCRERFRETFEQVNEAFQEMYPSLLGGGRARLELTNEDDLLETGVELFVQPPGKRLQVLNLLSGGEKAMAAIALIMALFKVKPSPFCVLDEVDAPLDEGNGTRFNTAIRAMARDSQFILITHNRKTMECADTLVGITMPVPGVSRLVTVSMDA